MYFTSFIIFLCIQIIDCNNTNINNNTGNRSYYFKFDKNGNVFKIHNRIHYLNHNITDYNYNYNHGRTENARVKEAHGYSEKAINFPTHFLDQEWNFNHSKIQKSELPLFLHNFYESKIKDATTNKDELRVLFNTNVNHTSSIIKFDLRSLKPNATILDAEMFIYLQLNDTSKVFEKSIVMRVYQFEKQTNEIYNESILIENPDVHKLFNVIYISKARRGWQAFKIKKPIDNWLNGEINLGLLVTISSYDNNKLIAVFNDTNNGVFKTFAAMKIQVNGTQQNNLTETDTIPILEYQQCHKHQFYIDFKVLRWNKFIIAPEGFATYECVGNCNKIHKDTINHVKLLAVVKQKQSCCVPVKYLPVPIMFYDEYNNIAIKNYDNAIPEICGCR